MLGNFLRELLMHKKSMTSTEKLAKVFEVLNKSSTFAP